ncbi:hypothetical protein SAMN02745174_02650 [Cetobacterium ceti]|uniref:Uncharacterized protein n=1 Tax=Cetobacterium ceti TaxID=180163 RepID=A0A1T4RD86_9FUSO|nr:hypothetical protein [Cetobacterium ceti]SKA13915.1 hypothetical protein SAMN02745174_02650 [Cetobacterium ceti]
MDILNFAKEHQEIIATGVTFLIAWLLPNPKIKWIGKQAGAKIPPKLAKVINEKIDSFQEGLMECEVDGDKNITNNIQIKEKTEKLKLDLGLDQKLKGKTSL